MSAFAAQRYKNRQNGSLAVQIIQLFSYSVISDNNCKERTMRNKALLLISFFLASGSALAEQGLLENAAKQVLKDTATTAAPQEAVKDAEATSQILEKAKDLKESVENAPDAVKEQAKETAKQKLNEAVPEKAKQNIEAAEKLKGQVDNVPKSSGEAAKAVKGKAKEKARKKALELLR